MDNLIIEINKNHAIKQFNELLNPFCDALYKKNKQINELQIKIKKEHTERINLASGYATKLGVLMTNKQYIKLKKPTTERIKSQK